MVVGTVVGLYEKQQRHTNSLRIKGYAVHNLKATKLEQQKNERIHQTKSLDIKFYQHFMVQKPTRRKKLKRKVEK